MPDNESPVTFRANEEDRKFIGDLSKWMGLKMSQVIRLALRRLHEEESQRRAKRISGVTSTRKR